jgi:hypothetical protein
MRFRTCSCLFSSVHGHLKKFGTAWQTACGKRPFLPNDFFLFSALNFFS